MMKKAVILGGGFAGIQTAIELQKSKQFEVILISERDYLFLNPISIWIPVHTLEFGKAKVPIADITRKYPFRVIQDTVKEIRSAERKVVCADQTVDYDYLVVAFGADKMGHKGIEHTLSICGKPEISMQIRDRLDALIAQGKGSIAIGFGGNPKDKSAVRGGPAFELAFNIHHRLKKKNLRRHFELSFFAPMAEPGARMGKNAMGMVNKMLDQYGIARYFGKKITEFTSHSVVFEDQSSIEADLILYIPASTGHSVLQTGDLPLNEAGFVKIDNFCRVPGFDGVYAIGDAAALEGPDWIAKQGHIAELMGRNAAHNIVEAEKNGSDFKGYQDSLDILCVMDTGNGAAFVYRKDEKSSLIPLPIVGHWLKQAWGSYSKLTKKGLIPRLPGM